MDDWDAPDADDLSHLWSAIVVLPHVSRLNDDEMAAYFADFDGRWSRQTRDAMTKLDASGLELNANWALTRRIASFSPRRSQRSALMA